MKITRSATDKVVISDVLAPSQHRAVEEDVGANLAVANVGH